MKKAVAITVCIVLCILAFKFGQWYGSAGAPSAEIAYNLLSGLSSATDSAIHDRYKRDQAELAEQAARLKESLGQAKARRIQSEKATEAAKARIQMAEASKTIEALRRKVDSAERELMEVLSGPAIAPYDEIRASVNKGVHLLKEENGQLRDLVHKQSEVIRRQELVIREFKSEVVEYERNLILWKERYRKAEKHISRFGSRKTRIAVGIAGAAIGVYVGSKVF